MSKFSSWPQKTLHAIVQLKISTHDPFQLFNDVLVIGFPWISGTFQSLSPSGPLWLQHLPGMFFPMLAMWRILPELLDFNKVSWSSDVPACLKHLTAVLRGPCYQHRIETLFSLMRLNVYHFFTPFSSCCPHIDANYVKLGSWFILLTHWSWHKALLLIYYCFIDLLFFLYSMNDWDGLRLDRDLCAPEMSASIWQAWTLTTQIFQPPVLWALRVVEQKSSDLLGRFVNPWHLKFSEVLLVLIGFLRPRWLM